MYASKYPGYQKISDLYQSPEAYGLQRYFTHGRDRWPSGPLTMLWKACGRLASRLYQAIRKVKKQGDVGIRTVLIEV